ncbi:MAG: ATP-binding protein [Chloroflexota bacterium]|nr:ATP-binding protein [Chloroflexota bacterium]
MDAESPTQEEIEGIGINLGAVFTPASPIDNKKLFSGRTRQLRDVIDGINQKGQHAIVYGERGVGKTSLASVLEEYLPTAGINVIAPKVTCDGTDTYQSVWRKVLGGIQTVDTLRGAGLRPETRQVIKTLGSNLPDIITPHEVQTLLGIVGSSSITIAIIDEFDRLPHAEAALFADTIKTLSDHAVPATIVLVGVADNVDELIAEHLSIERALVQVRMPRMSRDELHEIVEKGLETVGMAIDARALRRISRLSQGLPHYTHLLALLASRVAIDYGQLRVSEDHVREAVAGAVDRAQQTIVSAYHRATMSARSDHLYRHVLLASAMASCDDLGYFAAGDLRKPMTIVMGRDYDTPAFARHLNDFCGDNRGPVLERIEEGRRVRFRFVNPLMQPFVMLRGLADGMLPETVLVD